MDYAQFGAEVPLIPDLCEEAGTSVNGGQSVLNPWFIIGGVASSVCAREEFIMSVTFHVKSVILQFLDVSSIGLMVLKLVMSLY